MIKIKNNKVQKIKCNVKSCEYQDCDCNMCSLEEIEVKNMEDSAKSKDGTICSSFKLNKE